MKQFTFAHFLSILFTLFCLTSLTPDTFAQYGFGTNQPSDSSVIHIVSPDSSQGVILPFVTNTTRPGAANNIKGMMVYNISDSCIQVCNGMQWNCISEQDSLFTNGSVIFVDSLGRLSEDNENFFWDNAFKKLNLGSQAIIQNARNFSFSSSIPSIEIAGAFGVREFYNETRSFGDAKTVFSNIDSDVASTGYYKFGGTSTIPLTTPNNSPLGAIVFGTYANNQKNTDAQLTARALNPFASGRIESYLTMSVAENGSSQYVTAADDRFTVFWDRITFNDYGSGNKKAINLSNSESNYLAAFATDGTIIEVHKDSLAAELNDNDWTLDGDTLYSAPDSTVVIKGGNVGIGTLDPQDNLHVVGEFRMETSSGDKFVLSDNQLSYTAGAAVTPFNIVAGAINLPYSNIGVGSFSATGSSLTSPNIAYKGTANFSAFVTSSFHPVFTAQGSFLTDAGSMDFISYYSANKIGYGSSYTGNHIGFYHNPTIDSIGSGRNIAFYNTTGDNLLNTSSGNTGIGTNLPTNQLHVSASSDPLKLEGLQTDASLDTILTVDANGVVYKIDLATIADSIVLAENGLQILNNKVVLGNDNANSGPANFTSDRYLNLDGNNFYVNGSVNTDSSVAAFLDNGDVIFGHNTTAQNFIPRFFWDKSKGSLYFGHTNTGSMLSSLGNSNLVLGYAYGGGDYSIVGGFNFKDTGNYSVSLGSSNLSRSSNYSFVSGHTLGGYYGYSTVNGDFDNDGAVTYSTVQVVQGAVINDMRYSHVSGDYSNFDNVDRTFGHLSWAPYTDIAGNEKAYLRNIAGSFINVASSDTIENMTRSILVGNRIKSDGANRSFILGNSIDNTGSDVFLYNGISSTASTTSTDPYTITNSTSNRFLAGFTNGFDFATAFSGGDISNGMRLKSDNTLQLLDYGDTTHTGTVATILATDNAGNVIETTLANLNDSDWILDGDTLYSAPDSTVVIRNGNVGIGISTPVNKLHVSSNSDPLKLEGLQTDASLDTVLTVDANGVVHKASISDISDTLNILVDGDGDTKIQVEEGGADEDWIRFDTKGSERMVIDSTGNVGIGVSSPGYNLQVEGSIQTDKLMVGQTTLTDNNGTVTAKFGKAAGDKVALYLTENSAQNSLTTGTGAMLSAYTSGSSNTIIGHNNYSGALNLLTGLGATYWSRGSLNYYAQPYSGNSTVQYGFYNHAYHQFAVNATTRGFVSTGQMAVVGQTVSNHYDFVASPFSAMANGTITNRYGMYISFDSTNISNPYGVYQNGDGLTNYFKGNTGIGTNAPTAQFQVKGNAKIDTGLYVGGGTYADVDIHLKHTLPFADTNYNGVYISNSSSNSGEGNYGGGVILSSANGTNQYHDGAAISSVQLSSDNDNAGLAFWVRSNSNNVSRTRLATWGYDGDNNKKLGFIGDIDTTYNFRFQGSSRFTKIARVEEGIENDYLIYRRADAIPSSSEDTVFILLHGKAESNYCQGTYFAKRSSALEDALAIEIFTNTDDFDNVDGWLSYKKIDSDLKVNLVSVDYNADTYVAIMLYGGENLRDGTFFNGFIRSTFEEDPFKVIQGSEGSNLTILDPDDANSQSRYTITADTTSTRYALSRKLQVTNLTTNTSLDTVLMVDTDGIVYKRSLTSLGDSLYPSISDSLIADSFFYPQSVIFANANGSLSDDSIDFSWDDSNNRLKIGGGSTLNSTLNVRPSASAVGIDGTISIRGGGATDAGFTIMAQRQNSGQSNLGYILFNNTHNNRSVFPRIQFNASAERVVLGSSVIAAEHPSGAGNTIYIGNASGSQTSTGISSILAEYTSIVGGNFKTHTSGEFWVTASPRTLTTTNVVGAFRPTSGDGEYGVLLLNPRINQTGGANGISRALSIQPVLVSAADFRAIELLQDTHTTIYQEGPLAINMLAGNTIIGDTSTPTHQLHVKDSSDPLRIEGLQNDASIDTVLTVDANGVVHKRSLTTSTFSSIASVSADYSILTSDDAVLVDASSAGVTVTLPAAVPALAGKKIQVKKIEASANNVTIDGNGAETIDGSASTLLNSPWQSITLLCDGDEWFIMY